jgi:methionyl-tRNA formyltransferase
MTSKKVVFMGTGSFAAPVLEFLYRTEHKIILVYTKKPQKQGRKQELVESPVHQVAKNLNLQVEMPDRLTNDDLEKLREIAADFIIVADYGFIIPSEFLSLYQGGCINLHPSALPKWRGAAPIQRAMIAGDEVIALSVMQMDAGLDTGPVFMQYPIPLDLRKPYQDLLRDYAKMSAFFLIELLNDKYTVAKPQEYFGASYANKILTEDEKINWQDSSRQILGKIMAVNPKAFTLHKGQILKIIDAELLDLEEDDLCFDTTPGTVIGFDDGMIQIALSDGNIMEVKKIQKPGGKILDCVSFLKGYKMAIGDLLE